MSGPAKSAVIVVTTSRAIERDEEMMIWMGGQRGRQNLQCHLSSLSHCDDQSLLFFSDICGRSCQAMTTMTRNRQNTNRGERED